MGFFAYPLSKQNEILVLNDNFDVMNSRTFQQSEEVTQLDILKNCATGTKLTLQPNVELVSLGAPRVTTV